MEYESNKKKQPQRRPTQRGEPTRRRSGNERTTERTQRRPAEQRERDSFVEQERRRERGKRNSPAAQEAQRRREERKERDSRAAQEAQRRREERKERERLDDLRQKQKRKAKRRTRKRISPETWKRLLIMGGIVVAVVLSMVIFFRVRTIEIVGNRFYSAEEIVQAAGVAEGDNLLTVSRGGTAGNIMAQLPYIETVRVTRKLPNTLVLNVTEFDATYAVTDVAGDCYLITANGKVTEKIEPREAKSHIQIEQPIIETPTIGQIMTVRAAEGEELAAQGQFDALTDVLKAIENADLVKQIVSVSVPSSYRITLNYEDRFEVNLGNAEKLANKLEFLKAVIAEQKDYATGTIDLSLSEGDKVVHVLLGN